MKTSRTYVSPATLCIEVVVESNLMASSGQVSNVRIDDIQQVSVSPFSETIEGLSFSDVEFK